MALPAPRREDDHRIPGGSPCAVPQKIHLELARNQGGFTASPNPNMGYQGICIYIYVNIYIEIEKERNKRSFEQPSTIGWDIIYNIIHNPGLYQESIVGYYLLTYFGDIMGYSGMRTALPTIFDGIFWNILF